ncbi:MAG: hypothetical protein FWC09_02190 [Lachnospiraceae bacterium]|nr:hypothetical protein [Lachnospiraceae bacterium]
MNKTKLNIRYHNPNTEEETRKYIANIFIQASKIKFENILRETHENSVEKVNSNNF